MKAEIFNVRGWIDETVPEKLIKHYTKLLKTSGFDVLGFQDYFFNPMGWSGLWLLGESHLAIHTFPEENKSYIELSSCNRQMYEYFIDNATITYGQYSK